MLYRQEKYRKANSGLFQLTTEILRYYFTLYMAGFFVHLYVCNAVSLLFLKDK